MSAITPKALANALIDVLPKQPVIPLSQLAEACKLSEDAIVSLLFKSMDEGYVIKFRYPPIPCGAVTGVSKL